MTKLAIHGGAPLRQRHFPPSYIGVSLYGEEEINQLKEVIHEKSPFRHNGIGNPVKVATFEKEAASVF